MLERQHIVSDGDSGVSLVASTYGIGSLGHLRKRGPSYGYNRNL